MAKQKQTVVEVEVASSVGAAVFQPADWSVINIPLNRDLATDLFRNLNNTAVSNHNTLILCRHRRKDRLKAMANVSLSEQNGWEYLETVNITYPKPSSCSNNGFLPLSEVGFLFYKNEIPDTKKTAWFSCDERANASTLWDLGCQEEEGRDLYYQRFSWELQLLMKSLSGSLETRRFIYGFPPSDPDEIRSIYKFCKTYEMTCRIYVESDYEAKEIMKTLEVIEK